MDRGQLAQARSGVSAKIKLDPITIVISRPPMLSDGFGGLVQDPTGTPIEYRYTVRISHDSKGPADISSAPSGFSTNLFRYVLADHKTDLHEGDRIAWQSKTFMVGPVDPLTYLSEVIGYQAPLKEAV